jgi:hypothetical protein
MAKSWTLSVAVALWFVVPLEPVTVRVEFAAEVDVVVFTVRVEVPEPPGIDVELKLQVVLAGHPLRPSVTVPLNPFTGATVTV